MAEKDWVTLNLEDVLNTTMQKWAHDLSQRSADPTLVDTGAVANRCLRWSARTLIRRR